MEEIKIALLPKQRVKTMMEKMEGWKNAVSFPFIRDVYIVPMTVDENELLPCTKYKPLYWYLEQVSPKYLLMPVGEIARELVEEGAEESWMQIPGDDLGMYMLSRRSEKGFPSFAPYGASILCHREVLKEVAAEFGEGFYILPSSVHEVIIVPESLVSSEDSRIRLSDMVKTVNANEVSPGDFLSNHLYHYDDRLNRIYVAIE